MTFLNQGFWAHLIISILYLTTSFIFDSNFVWVIALNDFYGLFLLFFFFIFKGKRKEVVKKELKSFCSDGSIFLKIFLLPLYAFYPILGEFSGQIILTTDYVKAAIFIPLFYSLFKFVMAIAFEERSPRLGFLGLIFLIAIHFIDYKFSLPFLIITIVTTLIAVYSLLEGLHFRSNNAE